VVTWYRKTFRLEELGRFVSAFEEVRASMDQDARLALFAAPVRHGRVAAYVPGPLALVRELSPNGWEISPPPPAATSSLVIGSDDAWERFGVERDW